MSYPLRALILFLSTPFHTVLGLTVMQSSTLLAGDWYPNLELGWANPATDQTIAGGLLWAGGEFVAVTMLGALVAQWMRHAGREARRVDRDLDRQSAGRPGAMTASAPATSEADVPWFDQPGAWTERTGTSPRAWTTTRRSSATSATPRSNDHRAGHGSGDH
jgi:putative copper resistance protein D